MINTEWESHGKRLREALQFGLLMPPCIAAWVIEFKQCGKPEV